VLGRIRRSVARSADFLPLTRYTRCGCASTVSRSAATRSFAFASPPSSSGGARDHRRSVSTNRPPGQDAQVYFGKMGPMLDPVAGRVRSLWCVFRRDPGADSERTRGVVPEHPGADSDATRGLNSGAPGARSRGAAWSQPHRVHGCDVGAIVDAKSTRGSQAEVRVWPYPTMRRRQPAAVRRRPPSPRGCRPRRFESRASVPCPPPGGSPRSSPTGRRPRPSSGRPRIAPGQTARSVGRSRSTTSGTRSQVPARPSSSAFLDRIWGPKRASGISSSAAKSFASCSRPRVVPSA
jgi:hypothetical protein